MITDEFSWVKTHKELANYLSTKENSQQELIEILEKVGIGPLNDKDSDGPHDVKLEEIDPFTFFCYIHKYGAKKRLEYLKKIALLLNITIPNGESGIPTAQAQKVWLFPYKYARKNNEIKRLWSFFYKALANTITEDDFQDVLKIRNTGQVKLTEALFYIDPEKYLPINGPVKPYINNKFGLEAKFDSYAEYLGLLENIKTKTSLPFYELSYTAWQWNSERNEKNYWIFQGNPNIFDFETALIENLIEDWTVTAHKDKIKTGDKVIIWITGKKAGCYALAEVTSEPLEKSNSATDHLWKEQETSQLKAGITITHNLIKNPIFQNEIASVQNLYALKIGNQGTNFKSNKEEFEILLELAEKKPKKKYWLYSPGENGSKWDEFYDQGIMAIGWEELGDLNNLGDRENITEAIKTIYNPQNEPSNIALANLEFRDVIKEGDIIIAKKGKWNYLGYGIVTSDYFFDSSRTTFQKCRRVEWKKKGTWDATNHSIVVKTLTDITKYPDYVNKLINLIGIKEMDMENTIKHSLNTIFFGPPGTGKTYHTVLRAAEIIENRIIDSYDQALAIYKAKLHDQIEFITFHQNYSYEDFVQGLRPDTDKDGQLSFEKKDGIFKIISNRALKNLNDSKKSSNQIHALNSFKNALENLKDQIIESETKLYINETAYFTGVEDDAFRYSADNWNSKDKDFNGFRMKFSDLEVFFEENITERQQIKNLGNVSGLAKQHATYFFKVFQKIKSMMQTDENVPTIVEQKNYVLIIDEINRANISRVFGELITLIEPDKRSHGDFPIEARLPSGDLFIVPSNLFIIGTMNTADKSIALLDIALRRRFEFEAMYPKYEIKDKEIYDTNILKKINEFIVKTKGYDFQIGHAYFMGEHKDLLQRMNKYVIPLLMEYYMNDEKEVRVILQSAGLKIEENSWPIRITGSND